MSGARSIRAVLWRRCSRWVGFAALLLTAAAAGAQSTDDSSSLSYKQLWTKGEYQKALDKLTADLGPGATVGTAPLQYLADRAALLECVGRVDDAIKQLEGLARDYPDPAFSVPLALDYRERGRLDDYRRTLTDAERQARGTVHYADVVQNAVAVARLLELEGTDPKLILTNYLSLLTQQVPDDAEPLVAAGDLSYRKYAYDVAAEYYDKALKLEADNQGALAGLAECYWKSDDPRLEATIKKLLDVNPNSPRAKAIAVERMLDNGDADKALTLVATQLKINPHDLHYLALKAAAQFLADDAKGLDATRQAALAFNPHCAEVYSLPARVASRHYRFSEAVAMLRQAMRLDPDDHAAQADLAFNLLRLGDQSEGRTQLEAAFKADPYNVHAYNLLQVMDAIGKFQTIRDGRFILQLPEDDARLIGQSILETVQTEANIYQAKYDVQLTSPVMIQMFDDHDQFMVRSIGLPGNTGHLGICFGRLVTLDSPKARTPGAANWRDVLWHEFVHVVTLQKTNNRMPRWLSEGISVYEEGQGSAAWGEKLDVRYAPLVAKEGYPKLADLERYFTEPKSQVDLLLGYFMAGEFVHFYIDTYGIAALDKSLAKIGEGADTHAALIANSGGGENALNARFLSYLEKRCAPLKNLPIAMAADTASSDAQAAPRLPPAETPDSQAWIDQPSSFTTTLRAAMEAASRKEWDAAEKGLLQADELFPDYDGPDAPLRLLAHLYGQRGQTDQEKAVLRRIIERDGTALAECKELLALLVEEKRWDEVSSVTQRAFDINPFDVDVLLAAHESYLERKDTRRALATAEQLTWLDKPHATDYRLEQARLLLQLGERDRARQVTLSLLEEMPYYWEAQQLLLKIVEDKGGGAGT